MNSRLRSFLAFSLIIVSTLLVAAPVQADQQSAAEELQEATDLILSYAKGRLRRRKAFSKARSCFAPMNWHPWPW